MDDTKNSDSPLQISIEIVHVDYYMRPPLHRNGLHGLPDSPYYYRAKQTPVIRIFGATPAGQKACAHIHGIFPYFYIGSENDDDFTTIESIHALLPQIAVQVDNALNQKNEEMKRGRSWKRDPAIAKLEIIQAKSFYGYNASQQLFIKVSLYNPRSIPMVVKLLEDGRITDRIYDIYEAHIPYLLQVFADYQLAGMSVMYLQNVKFRGPLPVSQGHLDQKNKDGQVYLESNVTETNIHKDLHDGLKSTQRVPITGRHIPLSEQNQPKDNDMLRQSTCALEFDVSFVNILNKKYFEDIQQEIASQQDKNLIGDNSNLSSICYHVPSLAAIWKEEKDRRQATQSNKSEGSFPKISPTIDRQVTPRLSMVSAASDGNKKSFLTLGGLDDIFPSPISQSTFHKRMKESLMKVVEEYQRIHNLKQVESAQTTLSPNLHNSDSQSASVSTNENLGSFESYSQQQISSTHEQIDHNGSTTNTSRQDEDESIMSALLEMQESTGYKSPLEGDSEGEDVEGRSFGIDVDDSQKHNNRREEEDADIQAILASQFPVNKVNAEKTEDQILGGNWWEIGDSHGMGIRSLDTFGSRRIPQQHEIEIAKVQEIGVLASQNSISNTDNLAISSSPNVAVNNFEGGKAREYSENSPKNSAIARLMVWTPSEDPPSLEAMVNSSNSHGIPETEYIPAFYSRNEDIPAKPITFGAQTFTFKHKNERRKMFNTEPLRLVWANSTKQSEREDECIKAYPLNAVRYYMPVFPPPSVLVVKKWLSELVNNSRVNSIDVKTTDTPKTLTQKSQLSSTYSHNSTPSNITFFSLEIHATSHDGKQPDPKSDSVNIICYMVEAQEGYSVKNKKERGIIILEQAYNFMVPHECKIHCVAEEIQLFHCLENIVREWDPDFFVGFEVQKASIGYLIDRASQLSINLIQTLSRLPLSDIDPRNRSPNNVEEVNSESKVEVEDDGSSENIGREWGMAKAAGLWVHGRHILNIWRMARSELKLSRYTLSAIVEEVFHYPVPEYSQATLELWYNGSRNGHTRIKVVKYLLSHVEINLKLLSKLQLITRTSAMARLFGMDFYSVLSRGSQYRVESVILRVVKRQNYLLLSPNREQVARQPPMECIPLVMEPHSLYYPDPVAVLDFQSLYPSLIIAYNLCYSTYLGRLQNGTLPALESVFGTKNSFTPDEAAISKLYTKRELILAPNGALFCSKNECHGVLPLVLSEILTTRIMVKSVLKELAQADELTDESSRMLEKRKLQLKLLDARQLALKMIANVTYGYTAAGFSGRMPCAQLADAIVQFGRKTLESAVRIVESHASWNAKVVYGDTDSLFVILPGRSREESFRIGHEIADAVTAANPKPVKLKLEKIYFGSVLVSKKRYVGNKFESPAQTSGVLDAKGIEIVRRDSCGVVQNSMKKSLEILFQTSNLSLVRAHLASYWNSMLNNELPLKDFIFAKEVRLGTYSSRMSAPPAALVSMKAIAKDPRAEPRYAERVPYVVVNGPPGARLMDLVMAPSEFINNKLAYSLNYYYYIHKQMIPGLERLFMLMGGNIRQWFAELPRSSIKARPQNYHKTNVAAIDAYYSSTHCRLCGAICQLPGLVSTSNVKYDSRLCPACERDELASQVAITRHDTQLTFEIECLKKCCWICDDEFAYAACQNNNCNVWNRIHRVNTGNDLY